MKSPAKKRRSKYNSKMHVVNDIKFHSKKEAERYKTLLSEQNQGRITNLERQKTYKLEVNGEVITTYRSDFEYDFNGGHIVEDSKGAITPQYKIKKKLMWAIYRISILET